MASTAANPTHKASHNEASSTVCCNEARAENANPFPDDIQDPGLRSEIVCQVHDLLHDCLRKLGIELHPDVTIAPPAIGHYMRSEGRARLVTGSILPDDLEVRGLDWEAAVMAHGIAIHLVSALAGSRSVNVEFQAGLLEAPSCPLGCVATLGVDLCGMCRQRSSCRAIREADHRQMDSVSRGTEA